MGEVGGSILSTRLFVMVDAGEERSLCCLVCNHRDSTGLQIIVPIQCSIRWRQWVTKRNQSHEWSKGQVGRPGGSTGVSAMRGGTESKQNVLYACTEHSQNKVSRKQKGTKGEESGRGQRAGTLMKSAREMEMRKKGRGAGLRATQAGRTQSGAGDKGF